MPSSQRVPLHVHEGRIVLEPESHAWPGTEATQVGIRDPFLSPVHLWYWPPVDGVEFSRGRRIPLLLEAGGGLDV